MGIHHGFASLNWIFPPKLKLPNLPRVGYAAPTPSNAAASQRYPTSVPKRYSTFNETWSRPDFFSEKKKTPKETAATESVKGGEGPTLCFVPRHLAPLDILVQLMVLQSAPTQRPAVVLPTPGKFLQFQVPTLRCLFRFKLRYAIYRYH